MGWRVVVVDNRAKLDFKMNYMVVRKESGCNRVYINEIQVLVIASTAVSLTAALLNQLIKAKVKIIFCDEKFNPTSELVSLYGSHNTSKRCREQIGWSEDVKQSVWTVLVRQKIRNQASLLKSMNKPEYSLLDSYVDELLFNDESQREGHAAKVYFNSLFGKLFTRDDDNNINAALDYGYSILLSAINREIIAMGYLTQLGLNHCNQFNPFNLSCDIIEPLRGIVDRYVVGINHTNFTRKERLELIDLLNSEVKIEGTNQYLSAAIKVYCKSIFDALKENDISLIRFVEYEL
ncbi:type II CRISPR-associated endonuclease Cas1 [Veillonella sp.]|uniref:type II CRISPR-associated endonuclease Cas1 n=1 Tax=Veillonella sp. TaxID=1926307 RepID=UPI0025DED6D2|nr:type II CRISPR-associated endonuclease Cas1 [Veillonella sp.]